MDANLVVTIGLIGFGVYAVLFNRRFTETVIREQKAVWKLDLRPYQKHMRVFFLLGGIVFLGVGLWTATELLFP